MHRSYLLLIFLFSHLSLFGQLSESFSDSNFTDNPIWIGDTSFFKINSLNQLQSNGPNSSAQIHLSTPNAMIFDTEWRFYIHLALDITTSNWAKVYLTSDRANTKNYPKGYYIKFDGTTNSVDLYKQDSTSHTKLISGKPGRADNKTSNLFLIKVVHELNGNWHLFSDSSALGTNFVKEGLQNDTTFKSSNYSGVYFNHSSTRKTNFNFDDFSINQAPLSLLSANAISPNKVTLKFSKDLDLNSATDILNYILSDPSIIIANSSLDQQDNSIVHLQLSNPLNTYTTYSIEVKNILDFNMNEIDFLNSTTFNYSIQTSYGDLIISEIFADPSPQNGLPEVEYIELYNRKSDTIDLSDYKLSDGNTTGKFPPYKIAPNQYLIVCNSTNTAQFSAWPKTIGLATFPSLNNSGDNLTLTNKNNVLLHEVNYSDNWYADNDKKLGGWSLEMIDLNNPCGEEKNWSSSTDPSGGTPSLVNSINAVHPDLNAPIVLSAFIIDEKHVELVFDEKPNVPTTQQFKITNQTIISISNLINSPEKIIVEISGEFKPGKLYKLIVEGVQDCNGNSLQPIEFILIRPEKASQGDVIINELLFNPKSGGTDFVELYNASEKYIDLKNWQLANSNNGIITNRKIISTNPLIIRPKEYLAITENKNILINYYPFCRQQNIFSTPDLPTFNDDEGNVLAFDSNNVFMDRFDYNESMHYKMIDDKEGISLERISFKLETNDAQNWHSASSQVGYATPGYLNSQHYENSEEQDVWVEPQVFTPDNNGNNDFTSINYKFKNSGNMANITIYDHNGREIISLVKNELLSMEGWYKWEGNNSQNEKVRTGVYIINIELFNLNGEIKNYKKTVVVGWSN